MKGGEEMQRWKSGEQEDRKGRKEKREKRKKRMRTTRKILAKDKYLMTPKGEENGDESSDTSILFHRN